MAASFVAILDMTIVAIALPEMVEELDSHVLALRWVLQGYTMSFAVFTLSVHKLVGRFGTKQVFTGSLSLFTAASALCALAPSAAVLNWFRVIQGAAGGVMVPTATTIIADAFPPEKRGTGFGYFGLVIITAPALGPVLGGVLLEHFGFRSIFLLNLPVGLVAMGLAACVLPQKKADFNGKWDLPGFFLVGTALFGLLYAASEWKSLGLDSPKLWLATAAFLVAGTAFIRRARRVPDPVLPLDLLRETPFRMLMWLNLGRGFTLFARVFLLPILLQEGFGFSPLWAALCIAPGPLLSGLAMPLAGKLSDRFGPFRFIAFSTLLMVVTNLMLAAPGAAHSLGWTMVSILFYGLALGVFNPAFTSASMNAVEARWTGAVSSYITVIMNTVASLSVAVTGLLFDFGRGRLFAQLSEAAAVREGAALCFAMLGLFMLLVSPALVPLLGAARPAAKPAGEAPLSPSRNPPGSC